MCETAASRGSPIGQGTLGSHRSEHVAFKADEEAPQVSQLPVSPGANRLGESGEGPRGGSVTEEVESFTGELEPTSQEAALTQRERVPEPAVSRNRDMAAGSSVDKDGKVDDIFTGAGVERSSVGEPPAVFHPAVAVEEGGLSHLDSRASFSRPMTERAATAGGRISAVPGAAVSGGGLTSGPGVAMQKADHLNPGEEEIVAKDRWARFRFHSTRTL